jgi:LPS export ABC transporter protein LptC
VVALVGAACTDVNKDRTFAGGAATLLDSADQVAFGSRTLVTDAGLLRAEIFADTTFFLEQNTRISMRVVNGDFFNAQGSKDATMVSARANYDSRNGVLEAWGNVIVTSVDGRVLKSPMLRYDQRQNQILSDSAFVLTEADGKEMRGVGFRADPNLTVVTVLRLDEARGGVVNLSDR